MKPPTELDLVWDRDLVFSGRSDQAVIVLDSAGIAGPSPVQTLLFALAGCMGMDVVHVLRKGRHDLRELRLHLVGERAQEDPHRVTAVTIDFAITGAVADAQVQRAIDLSHEKYCSVWHSLRQDIRLETRFTISPGLP
ncbi:MAG: OsmC family protein [Vicinamibacterales bacterium]